MSSDSAEPQNLPGQDTAHPPKKRGLWVAGIIVLCLAAIIFYFNSGKGKNVPEPAKKAEPHFHRDEPTEKQIFQADYKTKVREMIDSGKSVPEISKETKIRIDEVRAIKKEYKKEKESKKDTP